MRAWYRAALASISIHSMFFILFIFIPKGNINDYRIDLVSLGSILRAYDVNVFPAENAADTQEAGEAAIASDAPWRRKAWFQGIQADKPNAVAYAMPRADNLLMRFTGNIVNLDDEPAQKDNDIPHASLMDIRLQRP